MNYITNQSGERIPAVGSENSPVRMRDEFDETYLNLWNMLCEKDGPDMPKRQITESEYKEFRVICRGEDVPKEKINALIDSVTFYYYGEAYSHS